MIDVRDVTFRLLPLSNFSTAQNSKVPHNALHDAGPCATITGRWNSDDSAALRRRELRPVTCGNPLLARARGAARRRPAPRKGELVRKRRANAPPYDSQATLTALAAEVERTGAGASIAWATASTTASDATGCRAPGAGASDKPDRRLDWTWITGNHDPGFADHCGGRIVEEARWAGSCFGTRPGPTSRGRKSPAISIPSFGSTSTAGAFRAAASSLRDTQAHPSGVRCADRRPRRAPPGDRPGQRAAMRWRWCRSPTGCSASRSPPDGAVRPFSSIAIAPLGETRRRALPGDRVCRRSRPEARCGRCAGRTRNRAIGLGFSRSRWFRDRESPLRDRTPSLPRGRACRLVHRASIASGTDRDNPICAFRSLL
jgi:hypothetical protein